MTTPIPAAELERLVSVERFASFRRSTPYPQAGVARYTWNAPELPCPTSTAVAISLVSDSDIQVEAKSVVQLTHEVKRHVTDQVANPFYRH